MTLFLLRAYSRVKILFVLNEKIRKPKFTDFSFGGDKRDRTADLLNAIQALSQLSYTPMCNAHSIQKSYAFVKISYKVKPRGRTAAGKRVVDHQGFEPWTP